MTIFWDPEDQRWCEECAEYVQQYHSVALLEKRAKKETQLHIEFLLL